MFLSFSKPNSSEDYIKLIIKVLLVFALFTPLFYAFNFYFPYIAVKNLLFRAIVEIAFFFYVFLLIRNRSYWPQFNKAFPILILFVFTLIISSLLGGTFTFSFWSNFERMDGLVNWLHLLIYVFTLMGILRSKEEWRAFFDIFLSISWLVAIYSFLQYFQAKGMIETTFIRDSGLRVYSTFGNAAYLGSYMLISAMLAFNSFVYRINKAWTWFDKNFWLLVYYVSSIIVFVISMILSQTRGSLVGLMTFSFFMYIFYLWFNKSRRNKLYYGVLSLFIVSFLFLGFVFQQQNSPWIQNNQFLNRITKISINHGTSQTRLLTWQKSFDAFKEKPVIGWGEENYKYAFDKYFPIRIYTAQASEVWFDRPHNILIQHLVQGGLAGLALYLGIFLYLMFALFRNHKRHKHLFFNIFWVSFLVAFLVHDLFIFDNLNVNVILYLILAYLFTIGVKIKKPSVQEFRFGTQKDYIFLAVIFLIWLNIFIFMIYNPWRSNKMLISALNDSFQAQNIEEAERAVDIWTEAGALSDLGDKERVEIATKMLNAFSSNRRLSDADKQKVLINFAEIVQKELIEITTKYPDDVRLKMFLVQFYTMTQNNNEAIAVLEEAKEAAPQRPEAYMSLSQQYLQLGNIEKSLENIEYYASILPKENANTYVYWNAFKVNLFANNIEGASRYLEMIKEANNFNQFKDEELSILRELMAASEENDNMEMAEMIKAHLQ